MAQCPLNNQLRVEGLRSCPKPVSTPTNEELSRTLLTTDGYNALKQVVISLYVCVCVCACVYVIRRDIIM